MKVLTISEDENGKFDVTCTGGNQTWATGACEIAQRVMVLRALRALREAEEKEGGKP